MGWLSYTAVTPRASLQSDADNHNNRHHHDDHQDQSVKVSRQVDLRTVPRWGYHYSDHNHNYNNRLSRQVAAVLTDGDTADSDAFIAQVESELDSG